MEENQVIEEKSPLETLDSLSKEYLETVKKLADTNTDSKKIEEEVASISGKRVLQECRAITYIKTVSEEITDALIEIVGLEKIALIHKASKNLTNAKAREFFDIASLHTCTELEAFIKEYVKGNKPEKTKTAEDIVVENFYETIKEHLGVKSNKDALVRVAVYFQNMASDPFNTFIEECKAGFETFKSQDSGETITVD